MAQVGTVSDLGAFKFEKVKMWTQTHGLGGLRRRSSRGMRIHPHERTIEFRHGIDFDKSFCAFIPSEMTIV